MGKSNKKNELLSLRNTLREESKDTANNVFMTESKIRAIDFDNVKLCYSKIYIPSEEGIHSVDSILYGKDYSNNDLKEYFIEFKNGNFHTIEILEKAKDSLLIMGDLENRTISYTRKNAVFMLVYNEKVKQPASRDYIHVHGIHDRAHKKYAPFGLTPLFLYFSDVLVKTADEFDIFMRKI